MKTPPSGGVFFDIAMATRFRDPLVICFLLAWLSALHYVGGDDPGAMFMSYVGIFSFFILAVQRRDTRHSLISFPASPAAKVLTAYMIWLLVALPLSLFRGASFDLTWVLAALPVGYLVSTCLRDLKRNWAAIRFCINATGVAVMAIALFEFFLLHSRPTSVFFDWNVLAAFVNMLFLPAFCEGASLWFSNRRISAVGMGRLILLILALATCAATSSRGGQLAMVISLAFITWAFWNRFEKAWQPAAIALAFLAVFSIAASAYQGQASALERLVAIQSDQSTQHRIEMIRSTLEMYSTHSWYGTGVGTYKILYPAYRSPNETSTTGDLAHNDYLQFLMEGGPILASLLVMLLLITLYRQWSAIGALREKSKSISEIDIETLGLSTAVVAAMLHASVNFIFYVLPMSLLIGMYLGRIDATSAQTRFIDLSRLISSNFITVMLCGLLMFATATLGLHSFFLGLTTDSCQLRMCAVMRQKAGFQSSMAAALAALQPSWISAQSWLINSYLNTAEHAATPQIAKQAASLAARELSQIIDRYPVLAYGYAQLGSVIETYPETAAEISDGIPKQAEDLYRLAILHDPLDTRSRVRLAAILEAKDDPERAFSLVFDDGMRWWNVATLGDARRLQLLRYVVPLALKLGRCKDAREMAEGLLAFDETDALATKVVELLPAVSGEIGDVQGCGIPIAFPRPSVISSHTH